MNILSRLRNIKSGPVCMQLRSKSYFKLFQKPSEEKYRAIDGMPQSYTLIYRNMLEKYLRIGQFASTFSLLSIGALVIYKQKDLADAKINMSFWEESPKAIKNEMSLYVVALMVIAVGLQLASAKMPLRIYRCKEKYIFVSYTNIPLNITKYSEVSSNISKLPADGIVPWKNSLYEVGNKSRIILVENYFRTPAELNEMLGDDFYSKFQ
ncbi:PREDICTED: uncharacterized protein LOC108561341 [Nicrophorus vespilloides]|uniref:Uncharacterized protein LOC108561341 n=1 Tax=Nicrophorus vespilloides TaxID=110193 RepID=A0ABM1MJG2_NICVS|nr:PREDICTED: uncharacterized protein LOC108561341 [Nicrophorus vespilloides]